VIAVRIRAALAAVTVAALAAAGAVASAPAAAQAASAVQVSPDGQSFGSSWSGQIFSGVALVPRDSVTRSFWVRNGAGEAAYLRITLADVVVHDADVADALAISSSVAGWPGTPVAVTAAQPCYVLTQGPVLASGGTTRVDTALDLGDLQGLAGQAGSVTFSLVVTLSSTALTSLPPTDCPSAGTTVIGYTGDGAPSWSAGRTSEHLPATGTGTAVLDPGTAAGGAPASDVPAPAEGTDPVPATRASAVVANTGRLWQELDVLFWLLLAVAGAAVALRRRRKDSLKGAAP
jgi:hypothetical protein